MSNPYKPDICVYHAPCQDGFGAAWAVWKRYPDVQFVAGVHGEPPPDVTGKRVLIVDFSYKYPVLCEMAKTAKDITVLDHHVSAQRDLEAFEVPVTTTYETIDSYPIAERSEPLNIRAIFDMRRSGAVLAWDFMHPKTTLPQALCHIQDRDLWKFAYPCTKAFSSFLFSQPYDFEVWDNIVYYADKPDYNFKDYWGFIQEGEAIDRKFQKDLAELLPQVTRKMVIGGQLVPVANLPYIYSSEGAETLAKAPDVPFAATYYDGVDARHFSLRSRKEGGADVSIIAASYGGGGHKNASGFKRPIGWEGDQ